MGLCLMILSPQERERMLVTSCLFDPPNTQPRGTILHDGDGLCIKSGSSTQTLPVLQDEAAPDRYRAIILDEGMPVREPRPEAKEVIRHRLAMEIVDEPATASRALRPLKKLHNLR